MRDPRGSNVPKGSLTHETPGRRFRIPADAILGLASLFNASRRLKNGINAAKFAIIAL